MFRPHIFVSAPNLLVFHLKFDFEADLAWLLDQIFSPFFSFFCWCFRGQNDPLQNAGVLSRVSFMCVRVHSFAFILPPFYLVLPLFYPYFTSLSSSFAFILPRWDYLLLVFYLAETIPPRFLRHVWLSFTCILPVFYLYFTLFCLSFAFILPRWA